MNASATILKPVQSLIPGIALEFTSLEQALSVLCMSHDELLRVLKVSPEWPYPAALDGWKLGHDAIRYDLDAIMSALETANATLVVRGRALPGWQVEALRSTVRSFYLGLHMHLAHKRTVLFPMLSARLVLPSKMLDYDEATLMALLDRVRGLCEGLDITASPTAKAAVRELYAGFFVLRTLLRQQMEREEVLGLPLLRMHFTAREAAAAERKLISQMRPADLAWLLRPLAEAEKKETLTRVGVPGLFQKLVLLPALRRADRAVLRTHRELASGEKLGTAALPPTPTTPTPTPSVLRSVRWAERAM